MAPTKTKRKLNERGRFLCQIVSIVRGPRPHPSLRACCMVLIQLVHRSLSKTRHFCRNSAAAAEKGV